MDDILMLVVASLAAGGLYKADCYRDTIFYWSA